MKSWIVTKLNTIGNIRKIAKTSSPLKNRKRLSYRSGLIEDFKYYMLMKQKGLSAEDINELLNIDNTDLYFSKLFAKYENLKNYMSNDNFLNFIYNLEIQMKDTKSLVIEKISYPIVLVLAVIASSFFFDKSIIPLLNDSILLFSKRNDLTFSFQMFLRFFWISGLIFFFIILVFLLRLKSNRFYNNVYLKLYRIRNENILCSIGSLSLARYYLALNIEGLSTNTIVDSLSNQRANRMVRSIGKEIKDKLLKGEKFSKIINELNIEKRLIKAFIIGEKTGELNELLSQYIEVSEILLKKKLNRVTKTIQYSVYLIASLIISILYTLLQTPLSVIENL